MKPATHLHPVMRLKMCEDVPPLPRMPSQSGSWLSTRIHLHGVIFTHRDNCTLPYLTLLYLPLSYLHLWSYYITLLLVLFCILFMYLVLSVLASVPVSLLVCRRFLCYIVWYLYYLTTNWYHQHKQVSYLGHSVPATPDTLGLP